ncbi:MULTISPECIES: LysR family transcriptional regulator [Aeromonas]|uniref:LysR family transcriptional regulator n=1 Tax=Aeromonas TaxID=642 RepID=UPI001626908F|nr:LysR family transcriptional regulator [Aeromonas dhakensis]MCR6739308.1 LysR family transcriptional regulator [Aeromonas dhakensis]MDX7694680.1 LysR family transcriptional regulator [Aeromonas dhakensis]
MLTVNDIKFFITIAACKNFSTAAKQLHVSAPYVTQKLRSLEEKLGLILIERQGRQLKVTEHGQILIDMGPEAIRYIASIEERLRSAKDDLCGHINILAPIGFGEKKLSPIIGQFKQKHPAVSIDLTLSDRPSWTDAPLQPDIMFYIGELTQAHLYRMVISPTRRILCASPDYIAAMPALTTPEQLITARHNCIVLRENNEDVSLWRFQNIESGKEYRIRVTPSLTSNIADVVKQWALDGLGIINRSEWDLIAELNAGTLVELLQEYSLPQVDIVALMATGESSRARKISKFLEFAKEKLKETL